LHDSIDAIEREIEETLHCRAIIHMDPVETDNAQINETREKIETLVRCIDDRLTLHDFRMVSGTTHTNVIFDLVVPYELKLSDKAIASKVSRMIQVLDPSYFAVIDVDKSFV
nr:cation-efflux pump [Clostridia bacterium]